jgi:futalosine hydrolase
MLFRILYVTATAAEAGTLDHISGLELSGKGYRSGKLEITSLITGVGSVSTSWALKNWIDINGKPDLAINGGIAGSYKDEYKIGDVVMPVSDCFADAGIEDGGDFLTLTEAGLLGAGVFPFNKGIIYSESEYKEKIINIIRPVNAITVNTATGSESSRRKLMKKFNPDIETMEGATFFYICSLEYIPFLALRAISNKVELRNKNKWNIPLALNNLSEKLFEVLLTLK